MGLFYFFSLNPQKINRFYFCCSFRAMQFQKITLLFFILIATNTYAQSLPKDTVYLVDGTFIAGEILNPGSENSIQVKNIDGAIIYIKNQRIEKLIIDPNRPISNPKAQDEKINPINHSKKAANSDATYRNRLIAINMFLGVPVGVFGSSSANKSGAGGANSGFGTELNYLKKIDPNLYWSLNFKYLRYRFNTIILVPSVIEQANQFPLSFSKAYWESLSFGGGLNWFYPINDDFKVSLGASIHLQSMKIPAIDVLLNGGIGTFEEQRGVGISPNFTASMIFKERFFFKFDFSTAKISFFSTSASGQVTFVQQIRALGFGLGVFLPKMRSNN